MARGPRHRPRPRSRAPRDARVGPVCFSSSIYLCVAAAGKHPAQREFEKAEKASRFGEEESEPASRGASMADWGPVIVATALFVVLTPGLLCTLPGRGRVAEFGSMHTSPVAIIVHAVLYFALITIFLIAIGIHIYAG
ncbi:hypothetical protein PAHAL_7G123500 [Panicum hallii]|nr:hypothetical protein PAHAL_7G123500 [Panicum hallii]